MGRLEDIRSRLEKATPGEWSVRGRDDKTLGLWSSDWAFLAAFDADPRANEANSYLCAHAPSDLRYLLGLLGEARTTLRIIADGIHEELATAGAREFLKKLEGA